MSLENTLREMLSEQTRPGPGIGAFGQTPIRNPPKEVDLSKGEYVHPRKPKPKIPGVDYNPEGPKPGNPTGIKEFYKARLEGALLGETHEMSALEGARREARSKIVDRIAAGILAGAVAAGGVGVGKGVAGSLIPTDVTTHNAQVAAGHVLQSDDVSSKEAMDTAKPLPAYRKLQRTAMERGLEEALLSEVSASKAARMAASSNPKTREAAAAAAEKVRIKNLGRAGTFASSIAVNDARRAISNARPFVGPPMTDKEHALAAIGGELGRGRSLGKAGGDPVLRSVRPDRSYRPGAWARIPKDLTINQYGKLAKEIASGNK